MSDIVSVGALRVLLSPGPTGLRNTFSRGDRKGLYIGFLIVGALFWAGLFGTMLFLVQKFYEVEGFGPFLARKLLEMLLASLFVMLSFSNVITALSTFFLSDDLELVLGLPVSRPTFHFARLTDTLIQSSWMMGLFGVPVFLAYGIVIHADAVYYLVAAITIPALLLMATNFGVVLATLLVNVFPARRTRELMVLLSVVMLAALFVLFRTLRPERLVDAQAFQSLGAYIAAIQIPAPVLFPPRWASAVMNATLLGTPFPWKEALLLATGTLASTAVARWATSRGFDQGWARAQEARAPRFYRSGWFDRIVRVLPPSWRAIAGKELRVFVRDPAQWSQVFLLAGLCAIYLVSINSLPVATFSGEAMRSVRESITFLNLGMGGFVMAAIAARFQFTAVSREGHAWWIVRGAPVDPVTVLRAKAAFGIVPMLVVGEIVTVGSGWLLDARPLILALEAGVTFLLAIGISGIASGMGAYWPDFRADNAARAASGPAAVFFMVVAQVLVFSVLALFIVAAYLMFWGRFSPYWAILPLAWASALCIFSAVWPIRRAAAALWARGI